MHTKTERIRNIIRFLDLSVFKRLYTIRMAFEA